MVGAWSVCRFMKFNERYIVQEVVSLSEGRLKQCVWCKYITCDSFSSFRCVSGVTCSSIVIPWVYRDNTCIMTKLPFLN